MKCDDRTYLGGVKKLEQPRDENNKAKLKGGNSGNDCGEESIRFPLLIDHLKSC